MFFIWQMFEIPTRLVKCVLLDWGDTVMRDIREYGGPMYLWPRVEGVPGIEKTLIAIRPGRIIAMASNALDSREAEIRKALARAGLESHFDRIFCFSGVKHMKPAAGFFEYILGDIHLEPENVVMVGDDFEKDIKGANNGRIFGIWFNETGDEHRVGEMHDTIHSMTELPVAIERRERWLADIRSGGSPGPGSAPFTS